MNILDDSITRICIIEWDDVANYSYGKCIKCNVRIFGCHANIHCYPGGTYLTCGECTMEVCRLPTAHRDGSRVFMYRSIDAITGIACCEGMAYQYPFRTQSIEPTKL